MKKISILIPAYNEEAVLQLLFDRLQKLMNSQLDYEWEIVFVNDGSSDNTFFLLTQMQEKDKRINVVDLSRNYGKEVAMLAGFDFVTGDCTVIIDADLQHPPELIPEMIQFWEEGYDDVYAKRIVRGGESFLRRKFSILFYKILQKTTKVPIQQDTGDFRLLDMSCIKALRKIRESQRYTKGMFSWIGFRKKELLFEQHARAAGETKWSFFKLLSLAVEGITSFTIAPLRISTIIGCVVSFFAFIYMIFVAVKTIIYGDPVQGFPTLIIIVLFLGGVQLLSLGVLGEYIGRIFYETKKRPTYIARTFNGKKID